MQKRKVIPLPERIIWLDIVRILAIFLVVFTHCIGGQQWTPMISQSDWILNELYVSAARICVPLFVMLSGALLLNKIETYTIYFGKRFSKIILPWILWTLIYIVWNSIFNNREITSFVAFAKVFYITFMSQFWFLPMITGIYLLTPPIRVWLKQAQKFEVLYIIALWLAVFSIYPLLRTIAGPGYTVPVPFVIEHLGYFILGYMLTKWDILSKHTKTLGAIFLMSVLGNTAGTIFAYAIQLPHIAAYFQNNLSLLIIAAATSCFLLIKTYFDRNFNKKSKTYPLIITLSNASFGIFFVHVIIIEALRIINIPIQIPYLIAGPLYALIVYSISLEIILLLQKTPAKRFLAT